MSLDRLTINRAGIAAMLKSDEVRAMLTEKMGPVLAAAQADPHDDTGAYEASLHIAQHTTSRAVVRVRSDDEKALALEANYGILARALDSA